MDAMDLVELAGARAGLLCRELGVEVAGIFPVAGGELLAPVLLSTGGACSVRLVASDLFRTALLYRAEQLVVVHNHLDGGPPSEADRRTTRRLRSLGASLGLPLLGHLVVGAGAVHRVE